LFEKGENIDNKYKVNGVCSDTGGMGTILFVTPLEKMQFSVVLKYCKITDEEQLKRFRREVRLLSSFAGNTKVVQIVDSNLDYDPPYFVMKYYPDGDLTRKSTSIASSYELQEQSFFEMIDCVQELHARDNFHRDIKPQNFLVDGDHMVVSDFGLAMELGSDTAFTRSSVWWGTHGYIPPEFFNGGFKHADAAGDIFMIGKTMYVLLTGRDPTYIVGDGIPAPILHIIERCCRIPKDQRYRSLAELKQSLATAYDVLLGRGGNLGQIRELLSTIAEALTQDKRYHSADVAKLVEKLAMVDDADQIVLCGEIPDEFYSIIGQSPVVGNLEGFLNIYQKLVDSAGYGFSYAETIAWNMHSVFYTEGVPPRLRAQALDLAIRAAHYMNRFAAMDTCIAIIKKVEDEALALEVAEVLRTHKDTFVANIEKSDCNSTVIRNVLAQIREQRGSEPAF